MADERADIPRAIDVLEAELKALEAEYNMYFAGRLPRPPWEKRAQVAALVRQLDQQHIANYGTRFRFTTLQTRHARLLELWDKALRAKEEGRPGPLMMPRASTGGGDRPAPRPAHVATFKDPAQEPQKLSELYDRVAAARREAGQEAIPFDRFAELVRKQVSTLRARGSDEVSFKVTVKNGKVAMTARSVTDGENE